MADDAEIEILRSLAGRMIVGTDLRNEDSELVLVLDDGRAITVSAHAYDEAWLTIDE